MLIIVMLVENKNTIAQPKKDICNQSLKILKNAVRNGETFFIKVHAAENLIRIKQTAGLEAEFLLLKEASPDNLIGSDRVLARLNVHHPKKYQHFLDEILKQFTNGSNSKTQLTALESLGKLGYKKPLPELKMLANTGTNGFKGMARWVLSNSNTQADEDRLSELLLSKEEIDYRYAAYALRFKSKINTLTFTRLKQCMQNLKIEDPARIYVISSLFVHDQSPEKKQVKTALLTYLTGEINQRYELAEALGLGRNKTDLPVLKKLLSDKNTDVQVAAANAILRIMNYQN
ncbi:MAG: HEAT repeat domain-containing protein [Sphingobacteriaceae bacterium]|nr:MAG: HEAT repeat domain-containing protein [Sphingobacteriaceae bacterium]